MKLIECYIENFGRLSDLRLSFSDGLNILCKENGFGKTTLTVFIKAMLFGLDDTKKARIEENDRKHYMPWQGGRFGGTLTFECEGEKYRIERTFMPRASEDTFALYDCRTGKESDRFTSRLGEELFGIDADGFERTVFLSERRLSVKNDNKTISAKLSDLVGADGDVGELDNAISALEERRKYYQKRGGAGKISDIKRLISENDAQLRELKRLADSLPEMENKITAQKREIEELEARKIALDERRHTATFEKEYSAKLLEARECERRLAEAERFFIKGIPDAESIRRAERAYEDASALERALRDGSLGEKDELQRKISDAEEKIRLLEGDGQGQKKKSSLALPICALGATVAIIFATLFIARLINATVFAALFIPALLITAISLFALLKTKSKHTVYVGAHASELERLKLELAAERAALIMLEKKHAENVNTLMRLKSEYTEFLSLYTTVSDKPFEEIRRALSELEYGRVRAKEAKNAALIYAKEHGINTEKGDTGTVGSDFEYDIALADKIKERRYALAISEREYSTVSDEVMRTDELCERARELHDELCESTERLKIIQLTKEHLSRAQDALTARYLGKTREAFNIYSSALGCEETELYTMDTSFALYRTEGAATRGEEAYSLGTRELLAFVMRLSLIDSLYETERPFIILDDPFAHLDDGKLKLAEELIRKIAKSRQIIYMTCTKARVI